MPELMLNERDIQANVLWGLRGYEHARYLFFCVTNRAEGRAWLAEVCEHVTSAASTRGDELLAEEHPTPVVNVALSHAGLRALGVADRHLDTFPDAFREGMFARLDARKLGRPDDDLAWWDPTWWHLEPGADEPRRRNQSFLNGPPQPHVMVAVHATGRSTGSGAAPPDEDAVNEPDPLTTKLIESARASTGVELLGSTFTDFAATDDGREHFGFADGIGQPVIAGVFNKNGQPRDPVGGGAMFRDEHTKGQGVRWRGLHAGEFVLGYPDEESESPPMPQPVELALHGSFLVCRRLYQDVHRFKATVEEQARRCAMSSEDVGAKYVGRRTDGSVLALGASGRGNDFTYAADPDGFGCPLGSHIRRANPRDGLDIDPSMINRHRMIRRSRPYGPKAPKDGTRDGRDRGIIFLAYVASISRQFELVQREWLGDANVFGQGHSRDVFAGSADNFTVQHPEDPRFLAPGAFVRALGGEYFFQPGLEALRSLAAGSFSGDQPVVPFRP